MRLDPGGVLVLGSKPDAPLPEILPTRVYTANGSALRAAPYSEMGAPVTCVLSAGALRIEHMVADVIALGPEEVIGRNTTPSATEVFGGRIPDAHVWNISTEHQFALQKRYFGLRAYVGLINPPGFRKKVRRVAKWMLRMYTPHVLSTGAWTVLLALHRHPKSLVFVAGIGVVGGPHWNDPGRLQDHTAMKTRYLFRRLPEHMRTRLVTTDPGLAALAGGRLWDGEVL